MSNGTACQGTSPCAVGSSGGDGGHEDAGAASALPPVDQCDNHVDNLLLVYADAASEPLRVTDAEATWTLISEADWYVQVLVNARDPGRSADYDWIANFTTEGLGLSMEVRRYQPVAEPGMHTGMAGMSIGHGRCLDGVSGWFDVRELVIDGGGNVTAFTAAFEEQCGQQGTMRGCVHVHK